MRLNSGEARTKVGETTNQGVWRTEVPYCHHLSPTRMYTVVVPRWTRPILEATYLLRHPARRMIWVAAPWLVQMLDLSLPLTLTANPNPKTGSMVYGMVSCARAST